MASARVASISRKTNETDIQVELNLDATHGSGITQEIDVNTGIGFLDHVNPYHPLGLLLISS
jgi:imidazoleglycerol-phosphate dehydratase